MENTSFDAFRLSYKARCDERLLEILAQLPSQGTELIDAMRYSLLNGGKRVRPLLAYAAAHAIAKPNVATDEFACALECLHTYSLIHDDLPAMDDDALRRGKPTCHIQYGEDTAILAGDALQCLAFEIIASADLQEPAPIVSAVKELANASGAAGMVLGQAIDLSSVARNLSLPDLQQMHAYKTGALIEASVVLGALSCYASDSQLEALRQYARAIGLAFQIQDDIIDVTSDTKTLGKTQGADERHNKPTYVSLLGLAEAKEKANTLCETAIDAISSFGTNAVFLRDLANFIVKRSN